MTTLLSGPSCAEFRAQHLSWLDSALASSESGAMRLHADGCAACERYDAEVRVGLLLARHLTPVTVSPGFRARLAERLKLERVLAKGPLRGPSPMGPSTGRMIA